MRKRLQLVAVVLALFVGIFVLLLAHDVRSRRDAFHTAALQYTVSPTKPVQLKASRALPSDVSDGLLAVGRDRQWLEALQKFNVAYQYVLQLEAQGDSLNRSSYTLLDQGEAALKGLTQEQNPTRSSQAFDLLGVLVFREAYGGTNIDLGLVQEGLTDLQNAVRLDQTNEMAKENLELSLRVIAASQSSSTGRSPANHASNARGGGYGEPAGEGY
jgi:hypothetical protein